MPLFIDFIDLTKAFDLVSRERLFAILLKIECPPKLFNIVKSFHTNTRATIQYNGSVSDSFEIKTRGKAKLRFCSNFVWNLLFDAIKSCFWFLNNWNQAPYKN